MAGCRSCSRPADRTPTSPTGDPNPRARRIFAFPQPATLARTLRGAGADPEHPTRRGKVTAMPVLDTNLLRPAQITAIGGIERSLAEQRFDRSLVVCL